MSQNLLPARQLAERLIKGQGTDDTLSQNTAQSVAAASDHLYRELCRWVGRDGCHALFTRALALAGNDHPALKQIHLRAGAEQYVNGVPDAVKVHGDAKIAESVEAMLAVLIDLLGRLVGHDVVTKLVEPRRDNAGPSEGMERSR